MSVRAYHLRRVAYRKTQGPVSNPGQPSPVNRKARRQLKRAIAEAEREYPEHLRYAEPTDPDPPLKCWCGQCLPGQDRECPAKQALDPRN